MQFNPVYHTLDSLAGGIEHVLGLDRCKRGCGCDELPCDSIGGCNCGMPDRMPAIHSMPMPISGGGSSHGLTPPRSTQPRLPLVPSLNDLPTESRMVSPVERPVDRMPANPAGESTPRNVPPANGLRDSAPRSDAQPSASSEPGKMTMPRVVPSETSPPADIPTQPLPQPKSKGDEGSIFDELNDPFMEDARRLRQPYQPIRPSALRTIESRSNRNVMPQPIRARSTSFDSRPAAGPIGSGLRVAPGAASLRPVSHEEPAKLKPLGGGRVLQPYRKSR
ncbi:MAG: hypothetical protein AAF802_10475 [Planctomycetota bacterium]